MDLHDLPVIIQQIRERRGSFTEEEQQQILKRILDFNNEYDHVDIHVDKKGDLHIYHVIKPKYTPQFIGVDVGGDKTVQSISRIFREEE